MDSRLGVGEDRPEWRMPLREAIGQPADAGLRDAPDGFDPWYRFSGTPARGFVTTSEVCYCTLVAWRRRIFHIGNVLRLLWTIDMLIGLVLAESLCVLCIRIGAYARIHPNLFIACVVFPLAFAINVSYLRRERALDELALLKAAALSYFHLHMDWHCHLRDPRVIYLYPKVLAYQKDAAVPLWHHLVWGRRHLRETYIAVEGLFSAARDYLKTGDFEYGGVSVDQSSEQARRAARNRALRRVYVQLRAMSAANERLRLGSAAAKHLKYVFAVDPPIITRPIHWLYLVNQAWERVRNIRDHRTPSSIRSYTKAMTWVVPMLLAPYFAWLAHDYQEWAAYFTCFVVTLMFNALRVVQTFQENPFMPIGPQAAPGVTWVRLVKEVRSGDRVWTPGEQGRLVPTSRGAEGRLPGADSHREAPRTIAFRGGTVENVPASHWERLSQGQAGREAIRSSVVENFTLDELDLHGELGPLWDEHCPAALYVTGAGEGCDGCYLVEPGRVRGLPVYVKQGARTELSTPADLDPSGPRYIFSDPAGHWTVTWQRSRFTSGEGLITTLRPHRSDPPNAAPAWTRRAGDRAPDRKIRVSAHIPSPATGVQVPPSLYMVGDGAVAERPPLLSGSVAAPPGPGPMPIDLAWDDAVPSRTSISRADWNDPRNWGVLPLWPDDWPELPTLFKYTAAALVVLAAGAVPPDPDRDSTRNTPKREEAPWADLDEELLDPPDRRQRGRRPR